MPLSFRRVRPPAPPPEAEPPAPPPEPYVLHLGDCREVLAAMPDNSVDAVVTDPPYGLSKQPDVAEVMRHWLAGDDYEHGGGGFMGKSWDSFVPGPSIWKEVYRVLKPGGHVLAFFGTRTYHLGATAVAMAGFEVRDMVGWIYGCLSEDSEALTRRGWVRGADLLDTDEVLQWDAATGELSWTVPTRRTLAPYRGPMATIKNRHTDQLLTPNHRVYAKIRRHARHPAPTDYEVVSADTVSARSSSWQVTLPMAGTLRGGEDVSPEYAYLVGWWLTDAWAHGDGKACMFSQAKPATLEKLRAALAPYSPSEYAKTPREPQHNPEHTFYVTGDLAERLLRDFPKRRLGWGVLGWGEPARRALYEGLMDGDGSQPATQHAHTFWSKRPERRDVFLALALSLGMRAYIGDKDCVYVNTSTGTTQVQHVHKTPKAQYDGLVWCVTVPTGAFVARRNGRPFITGNSGFPKSHNVSKAIDKAAGAEREVVGTKVGMPGYSLNQCANPGGVAMSGNVDNSLRNPEKECAITAPATDAARQWDGWGTALKPSLEPVVLARKPLSGTVVANVLEHGTGALNIDASRVGTEGGTAKGSKPTGEGHGIFGAGLHGKCEIKALGVGRWPANLIHDGSEEVLGVFPQTKSGSHRAHHQRHTDGGNGNTHGKMVGVTGPCREGDAGSAARFFYCAKASKKDRNEGCDHMPTVVADPYGQHRGRRMDGNNTRIDGKPPSKGKNPHPTVKPTDLMSYLIRLITPPNGVVLDPFMGSGSTGKAWARLRNDGDPAAQGRFIGIDLEPEHVEIARARIAHENPR